MRGFLAALGMTLMLAGCTGGTESSAATDEALASNDAPVIVHPRKVLGAINPAIPLYEGAEFRQDLTRRDQVMIRNQYGAGAEVYTLASDDSFPQVYHYYTTYLGQFRAFAPRDTYPPEQQNWRTLEVHLNQAMQDPFIPGAAMKPNGKQVLLQVAETEGEPKTVIRYIVTPAAPVATAAAPAAPVPVAR